MKNASGGREAAKGLFEREYHSDENQILDSLARIERKADKTAKQFGTNIDSIYDALGFDPVSYQLDSRNDAWLKETEQYAIEAMSALVPSEHRKYGGIRLLPEFLNNEDALFGLFEKPRTTEGEAVKRKEVVFKEEMGYVDKLIGWVDKHKKLTAAAIIGSLGFGAAVKYKADKQFADDVDAGLSKAKAEISASASGMFAGVSDFFNKPPIIESIIANNTQPIVGDTVRFEAKAFDPDGDTIKYNWQILNDAGFEVMAKTTPTPELEKVFGEPGKYNLKLEAVDDKGKKTVSGVGVEVGEKPFQFTPDINIVGSDSYKQKINERLKELDAMPNFKIRGMTARQYTEKYLEYLYEALPGTTEACPPEAIGIKSVDCLSENMADSSNLLHVARHNDQAYGELSKQFEGKGSYPREEDAVRLQSEWVAARFNFTEEEKQKWFEVVMKEYEVWKPK